MADFRKSKKDARRRQQEIVGRVVDEREAQQVQDEREREAYYASVDQEEGSKEAEKEGSGKKKGIQKGTVLYEVLDYVRMIVIVVVVVLLLQTFVVVNAKIPSASMEPTIMVGHQIFGNRLTYKFFRDPERYDIVIFHDPDNDKRLLLIDHRTASSRTPETAFIYHPRGRDLYHPAGKVVMRHLLSGAGSGYSEVMLRRDDGIFEKAARTALF